MELITYDTFAREIVKFNSFAVDSQLCLGSVIANDYRNTGIIILTDLNHMKWIVRGHEIEKISRIEKAVNGEQTIYNIVFANSAPKIVECFNRTDIESIHVEDNEVNLINLLDKDIFDDNISFILDDNPYPALVIGLDLRKLKLSDKQKSEIAKQLRNIVGCLHSSSNNDSAETLCLMVERDSYFFSFQGLDINTFDLRLLYISDTLYKNEKVEKYAREMETSYQTAYRNIRTKTETLKELSELTDIRHI